MLSVRGLLRPTHTHTHTHAHKDTDTHTHNSATHIQARAYAQIHCSARTLQQAQTHGRTHTRAVVRTQAEVQRCLFPLLVTDFVCVSVCMYAVCVCVCVQGRLRFHVEPDAGHHESAWAWRFSGAMEFLLSHLWEHTLPQAKESRSETK